MEEDIVDQLYESLRYVREENRSEEENAFYKVWDSSTLIYIGGFEKLIENEFVIDECINVYEQLDIEEASGIFKKVKSYLIPGFSEDELFEHLHKHFEELKELANQFYHVTEGIHSKALNYITRNKLRPLKQ